MTTLEGFFTTLDAALVDEEETFVAVPETGLTGDTTGSFDAPVVFEVCDALDSDDFDEDDAAELDRSDADDDLGKLLGGDRLLFGVVEAD